MNLNGFQILFGGLMALLATLSLSAVARRSVTRREGLLWTALCVAAALAVLWPGSISAVARRLGIGRGADLVSYLAVVVLFVGFLATYVRLRALRRQLTLLVRRLALSDPRSTGAPERGREP